MGNVGEGAAVNEGRGMLQSLHQVGLQGVLQKSRHCALGLQVMSGDRLAVIGIGHDHTGKTGLEVVDVTGQAQNRHDLGGHGDLEAILTGHALSLAAQTVHNMAQLTVVHIHSALPGDLLHVNPQRVALLNVVIQHGGHQVVGSTNGVEVAGEVQVDVLHGHHLSITAAGSTALDTKHRPQRGLTQGNHSLFPDLAQAVRKAHRGGGLTFAGGSRGNRCHQDQLTVWLILQVLQHPVVNLGLVIAILLNVLLIHPTVLCHFCDFQRGCFLGDFDITFETHALVLLL